MTYFAAVVVVLVVGQATLCRIRPSGISFEVFDANCSSKVGNIGVMLEVTSSGRE